VCASFKNLQNHLKNNMKNILVISIQVIPENNLKNILHIPMITYILHNWQSIHSVEFLLVPEQFTSTCTFYRTQRSSSLSFAQQNASSSLNLQPCTMQFSGPLTTMLNASSMLCNWRPVAPRALLGGWRPAA
jgi:hypothetical protein